jgi:protein-L-isoaspartate(D-aspartate) O-methyltransferase
MLMRADGNDTARKKREAMVAEQIEGRGIRDERVLEAMRAVPRERFVRTEDERLAFFDGPLSIGSGQTISQPYIVAYMTEVLGLGPDDKVLEVGTGSGYQTAILAELAGHVYTIECIEPLSLAARERLAALGCGNVSFRVGDGSLGWPEAAPFDAIIVTAAPGRMPQSLFGQLAPGGRMIVPVGRWEQYLYRIVRRGDDYEKEKLIGVRFVPMVGRIEENDT